MTEPAQGLYVQIQELADALDGLTSHGMAAIFGICGRALAPLLKRVEQRSEGRWAVPDLGRALDLIEAFATGAAEAADHRGLRARLMVTVPDEHPWSTYAQDTLICTDAGLAAASVNDRPKPMLIHFALEPLIALMQDRDVNLIRRYGDDHWSREIIRDPAMAAALGFMHRSIANVSQVTSVDSHLFGKLAREAAVLRPAGP
jgi:hypothetical protein